MALPSGYKRLEYIQSSGTQYIDTGYKPKQNTRVVMDLQLLSTSGVPYVFGTWAGGMNNCFSVYWWTDVHNSWGVDYGTQRSDIPQTNWNKRLTVDLNQNVVTVDSVSYTLTTTTFSATNNLFLLALNNGRNVIQYTTAKVYGCKIYDNGTLVRDFIPCKNAAGVIGLWDDVNSVFYGNAGTGTFTAGPVLAIAANASEITELEYIQSSGTQYVDSGFIPNGESTVEIAFESAVISSATSGNYPVYGAASNYNSNAFKLWSLANGFCTYGSQAYKSGFGLSANVRYISKQAKNVLEINNQTLTFTKQTFSAPYSLLLFATHRDSGITISGSDAKLKIYFCKIYDNGTLIRDYVAAKLSDGTIGLYDKLHRLLYTNMGTGTFTAGPVVEPPAVPTGLQQLLSVRLAWSPVTGATSYKVYRDGALLGSTLKTSFVDNTAEENREYTYGVSAVGPGGESGVSNITVQTKSGYFLFRPYVESATFQ